jgi:hypothetical protein
MNIDKKNKERNNELLTINKGKDLKGQERKRQRDREREIERKSVTEIYKRGGGGGKEGEKERDMESGRESEKIEFESNLIAQRFFLFSRNGTQ